MSVREVPVRHMLPPRRRNVTARVTHGNFSFHVTLGFFGDRLVGEVFATDAGKEGTELQAMVNDGCVLVSMLLQHGVPIEKIAASMGKSPFYGRDGAVEHYEPASLIGAILQQVVEMRTLDAAVAAG